MIALFSIAGALPVQTENLHSSPSICSVMPISAVCKYKMKKKYTLLKKWQILHLENVARKFNWRARFYFGFV